ncbi:MAG: carbohydrate kinase [Bacteroidaceae bacterium]|nr:carbohydrate kinase [Bacteroidaceae bacterium]
MRKVIGIGETILDVIFKNDQPWAAVPGGSVFNSIVSLAHMGVPVEFISEVGKDYVGELIQRYMRENGIDTSHLDVYFDNKSPVSLAFLNEERDAQYSFYKNYPDQRLHVELPKIEEGDIVMLGSFYAVDPALRERHVELLQKAKDQNAIVFYDLNFRRPHKHDAIKLAPYFLENLEFADIVRGSEEDFMCLYDMSDADKIYKDKIQFYCKNFVFTAGAKDVQLRSATLNKAYAVPPVKPVSTVGAGDNFNAGIVFGLLQKDIMLDNLATLDEQTWDSLIATGMIFAAEVCKSFDNSVPKGFTIDD